ncbi:hypothetical protein J6590_105119 [Homalodisca vitripennis]|nr:hypothetical protein J6590_105119 [Homalodisca vitripennis]
MFGPQWMAQQKEEEWKVGGVPKVKLWVVDMQRLELQTRGHESRPVQTYSGCNTTQFINSLFHRNN